MDAQDRLSPEELSMQRLEKIVPLACLLISLLLLSPFCVVRLAIPTVVWIHLLSYLGLGIFFELPELSLNALCLFWARDEDGFKKRQPALLKVLRLRYFLTHFVGPATGIMTVTSGVYLAFRGGRSFTEGWLFWILFVATLGLYKGMCQHNAYLRGLLTLSGQKSGDGIVRLRRAVLSPRDQMLIMLEFPTYIFIYMTAYFKPVWGNPFASAIAYIREGDVCLGRGNFYPRAGFSVAYSVKIATFWIGWKYILEILRTTNMKEVHDVSHKSLPEF